MLFLFVALVVAPTLQAQPVDARCSLIPAADPPAWQVRNNPPPIPTLLAPANGLTMGTRPVFSWTPVVDPEGDTVTFWIQIDDNADFASPVIDERRGPETSFTPDRPLRDGTYCWRVRSIDDIEAMSPYTRAFAITIRAAP